MIAVFIIVTVVEVAKTFRGAEFFGLLSVATLAFQSGTRITRLIDIERA